MGGELKLMYLLGGSSWVTRFRRRGVLLVQNAELQNLEISRSSSRARRSKATPKLITIEEWLALPGTDYSHLSWTKTVS
jgi:hypothetical protein